MSRSYEEVLRHVVAFLGSRLDGAPVIDENAHFTNDLHVGSLLIFALVEDLEQTYRIVVPLQLLYKQKIDTVADLVREVVRLTGES